MATAAGSFFTSLFGLGLQCVHRLDHHRTAIDRLQQVTGGGDGFSGAVARREALSGNRKRSVPTLYLHPLNMPVSRRIEGIRQSQDTAEPCDVALPARGQAPQRLLPGARQGPAMIAGDNAGGEQILLAPSQGSRKTANHLV